MLLLYIVMRQGGGTPRKIPPPKHVTILCYQTMAIKPQMVTLCQTNRVLLYLRMSDNLPTPLHEENQLCAISHELKDAATMIICKGQSAC